MNSRRSKIGSGVRAVRLLYSLVVCIILAACASKDQAASNASRTPTVSQANATGAWKQPWQVTHPYCHAWRDGPYATISLHFYPQARAEDFGSTYEIILEGKPRLDVPAGYPYDAQIVLDQVTYPGPGDGGVNITVIHEVGTGDHVFRIYDPKRLFTDAFFRAGLIKFKVGRSEDVMSLGASDDLLLDLKACYEWRFG
jgi:hypothetical protein